MLVRYEAGEWVLASTGDYIFCPRAAVLMGLIGACYEIKYWYTFEDPKEGQWGLEPAGMKGCTLTSGTTGKSETFLEMHTALEKLLVQKMVFSVSPA